METPLKKYSCAVCLQTKDPIKFNSSYGDYPGSGFTYLSWPMGSVSFYEDYISLYAVVSPNDKLSDIGKALKTKTMGTLTIKYGEIDCLYYKSGVIVIKHKNSKIPKNIWIASPLTRLSLLKSIKKTVKKHDLPLKFEEPPQKSSTVYDKIAIVFKILFAIVGIIVLVGIIALIYFLSKSLG